MRRIASGRGTGQVQSSSTGEAMEQDSQLPEL